MYIPCVADTALMSNSLLNFRSGMFGEGCRLRYAPNGMAYILDRKLTRYFSSPTSAPLQIAS